MKKLVFFSLLIFLFNYKLLIAQGVARVDFDKGMKIEAKDKTPPSGRHEWQGEGSSRRNDSPNTPKTQPSQPITPKTQAPPKNINPYDTPMPLLTPISKKALQDIRGYIFSGNLVSLALFSGYVLDFFTSNKWTQMYNVYKFYSANDLVKIAETIKPMNDFTKENVRKRIEHTILDLHNERDNLNSKKQNSDQVYQEIKFWEDLVKTMSRIDNKSLDFSNSNKFKSKNISNNNGYAAIENNKSPMWETYYKSITVRVFKEDIDNKNSLYTNEIFASKDVISNIKKVVYFYNDESFNYLKKTSKSSPYFEDSYIGWGCLSNMTATVYFKDGTYLKIIYDACEAIENQ